MMRQQNLKIAVVDDDDVFRSLVSSLLSKDTGFQIFEAASGQELDQIFSRADIDCVMLDYNLGNENGFSIKERMERLIPAVPPVVMLTGDGRESTVIMALRMGMDDYLPKLDLKAATLISRSLAPWRGIATPSANGPSISGSFGRPASIRQLACRAGRTWRSGSPASSRCLPAVDRPTGLSRSN
ncbi:putative sensor histidine kinase [Bradyrhizobium sp. ORS 285]|nr:putative sensor histidine kinase [Bradyrhizobium sp. ORS 285]SMX61047.1 putative sensor histidine kinase [Bradyrhizobium sp. ORS 285]